MRLHRLVLRNFRGVVHAEVDFPETGVTLIEGDNEVGKSSLTEALDLIFDFLDSSKKARVLAVQPVGRDVGPEVEVEFTTGPYRVTYAKRWLRKAQTTFVVEGPQREQLTGREAHDRVTAILQETLDLELWKAVQLRQGTELQQASMAVPSLSRALDRAAGGEVDSDNGDLLWERIVEERNRYFTPTGKPVVGRGHLADRLAKATGRVEQLRRDLQEMEADTTRMERLEVEALELRSTRSDLHRRELELMARAEQLAQQQRRLDNLQSELRVAEAEHQRLAQMAEARASALTRLDALSARLAQAESSVQAAEPASTELSRRLAQAVVERDTLRSELIAAHQDLEVANADVDHRRREIELQQFEERHDRVVQGQQVLARAEEVLETNSVDQDVVDALEQAHLKVVQAEAAAEAGAARVTIAALADLNVEINGQVHQLEAGQTDEVSVVDDAVVSVPEVVSLTLHPGADTQVLQSRRRDAIAEFQRLCDLHRVADLRSARAAAASRQSALTDREQAEKEIRAALRDLTLDALTRKVVQHRERISNYESERPDTTFPLPADLDAAQEAAGVRAEVQRDLQSRLADHEVLVETLTEQQQEAAVADASLKAQVAHERESLDQARQDLEMSRNEVSDDQLQQQLEEASARLESSRQEVAEVQSEMDVEDLDGLEHLVQNAISARERADEAIRNNQRARDQLRVLLDTKGESGLAHQLDLALTDQAHLTTELERHDARAEAARLLHDTFAAQRSRARARYQAPFRSGIERLAKLVFGPTLSVELDAELRIVNRTLSGQTVPFDQLSTGAREQLGLLARLAGAEIVSEEGGAPVILDDVLGWTDPGRLSQMAAAISVAGRNCQVVVLTCTPGRFAGVGEAHVVRLPVTSAAVPFDGQVMSVGGQQ